MSYLIARFSAMYTLGIFVTGPESVHTFSGRDEAVPRPERFGIQGCIKVQSAKANCSCLFFEGREQARSKAIATDVRGNVACQDMPRGSFQNAYPDHLSSDLGYQAILHPRRDHRGCGLCRQGSLTEPTFELGDEDENLGHQEVVHVIPRRQNSRG